MRATTAAVPATTTSASTLAYTGPTSVTFGTVSFAGDSAASASQTNANLTAASSAHGSVAAIVPQLTSGGGLELLAHVGAASKVLGELVYDGPHRLYIATTITALGISADGHSAWIAGKDGAGHTFLMNAVDAGGHGDKVRLWLDGTLVDGDGSIRIGGVQVDAKH